MIRQKFKLNRLHEGPKITWQQNTVEYSKTKKNRIRHDTTKTPIKSSPWETYNYMTRDGLGNRNLSHEQAAVDPRGSEGM